MRSSPSGPAKRRNDNASSYSPRAARAMAPAIPSLLRRHQHYRHRPFRSPPSHPMTTPTTSPASSTTPTKIGCENNEQEPLCCTTIRFLSLDSPVPTPNDLLELIPSVRRPQLQDILTLATKSKQCRTDDETPLLVQRPPATMSGNSLPPPTPLTPRVFANGNAPLGIKPIATPPPLYTWDLLQRSACWHAFSLVDCHGCRRPLMDPPLPSMSGAEDLPVHHSLVHPFSPFAQRV